MPWKLHQMVRKISTACASLIGVVFLIFILFQLLGDPAKMVAGQTSNKTSLAQIRKEMNLDKPIWKRFLYYINDLSPVSVYSKENFEKKEISGWMLFSGEKKWVIKWPHLGRSYQTKQKVGGMLFDALIGTIILAFFSMLFAVVVGIPMGIMAAVKKGTAIDQGIQFLGILGTSAPSFFVALLVAYLGGIVFRSYTGLNFNGSLFEINPMNGESIITLKNLILPAFTLGLRPLAMVAQMTRASVLEVLNQDYIRTARAKGLTHRRVLYVHALRNAMNPILTGISGWGAELLAGAYFVEFIFGWQGLGKLTVESLDKLDWPLLNGAILWSACIFILVQLLTDWLQGKLDPRI